MQPYGFNKRSSICIKVSAPFLCVVRCTHCYLTIAHVILVWRSGCGSGRLKGSEALQTLWVIFLSRTKTACVWTRQLLTNGHLCAAIMKNLAHVWPHQLVKKPQRQAKNKTDDGLQRVRAILLISPWRTYCSSSWEAKTIAPNYSQRYIWRLQMHLYHSKPWMI